MKNWSRAIIVAAMLSEPLASFAQSSQPVSRAQVRAELVRLEKAGYSPAAVDATYPADIQAARARVHAIEVAQAEATKLWRIDGRGGAIGPRQQAHRSAGRVFRSVMQEE